MLCPDGIIIINKTEGPTSHTVTSRVKRLFGASKAGHTGTLDPMATGVLPVLLERGVKASEYMISSDKHYIAVLKLGVKTDTEDLTGSVLSSSSDIPSEERVLEVVDGFCGKIMQIPPMYSALKQGGKKLCDIARAGGTVEREPREITVYSIKAKKLEDDEYSLEVRCSGGTYIRTLCKDIGERLGCGGAMKALSRASASGFTLDDAYTLEELEAMSEEQRYAAVVPIERLFNGLEAVKLQPFFSRLAHSGLEIYLKKIGLQLDIGQRVRLLDESGFFALGEVREYEDGLAIKPIKQFKIL